MRSSLRAKLLRWLLVPLSILWLADAAEAYRSTERTVNDAYDRSLYAAVLAISERLTLVNGRPVVDIPPVALEVLDTEAQDRVYYKVAFRSGGGALEFLTGYPDLPAPTVEEHGEQAGHDDRLATATPERFDPVSALRAASPGPSFIDASFHGYPVRVATLERDFPTVPATQVVVQVAETLGGRNHLLRVMVARQMLMQLLAILLAVISIWFGVSRGLRPLRALSQQVTRRSANDLAPLPLEEVPHEVAPVVLSVNELLVRLRETLSTQDRFIADASHALRTPLAVLRTEADLALRLQEPAALREAVVKLRDHVHATSHLANQLLTLARVGRRAGSATAERLDLARVAREASAALVPAALAQGADLGYSGERAVWLSGRAQELTELIGNLVDNALRYGRAGVVITVSVRQEDGEGVLAVEDNGPGVSAADRARVLEPFFRLPGTSGDGSGLGLAIVKEIADGHGADLVVGDGPGGRGLLVELRFPLGPGGERGAATAS